VLKLARSPDRSDWDEATLTACRQGDRAALERVLLSEAPLVERTLSRVVSSRPDVEDLMQKTFVVAIRGFARFRGEASVRTWLTAIALRLAQEHLRRARPVLEVVDDEQARLPDPETALNDQRRLRRLERHLGKIHPRKRVAFVLHVIEGRSIEEVAALTRVSKTAAKSRVFFARRELMKLVRHDPELKDLLTGKCEGEP